MPKPSALPGPLRSRGARALFALTANAGAFCCDRPAAPPPAAASEPTRLATSTSLDAGSWFDAATSPRAAAMPDADVDANAAGDAPPDNVATRRVLARGECRAARDCRGGPCVFVRPGCADPVGRCTGVTVRCAAAHSHCSCAGETFWACLPEQPFAHLGRCRRGHGPGRQ